ncbi:MAG TPA: CsgG/HfaB family protein [Polyangia bacterium]|jgi:TolB-like protein|nr:CsgG/HfaB family protein [Polyangia bacterium]
MRASFPLTFLATLATVWDAGASPAHAAAPTITVLYFDNDSGDPAYDHLGKSLADMWITDLSSLPDIRLVEREKLEQLLAELKLQRTRFFDPATAQKLGKGLGAQYAVTGSFHSFAPQIRLDTRIVRVDSGEVVKAAQVVGQKDDFFALQQQLVGKLVDGLGAALGRGVAPAVRERVAGARTNRVASLATALDYGRGLDSHDRGDVKAATQQMQKVIADAPDFGLARTRYLDFMKTIYAVKEERARVAEREGSQVERDAEARMTACVAARPPWTAPSDQVNRYFGCRVVRGLALRTRLRRRLDAPPAEVLPLVRAYHDNQQALIAEAQAYLAGGGRPITPYVDGPDMQVAQRRLGGLQAFGHGPLHPPTVALQLGEFLIHWNTRREEEDEASSQGRLRDVDPLRAPRGRDVCFFKLDPRYADAGLRAAGALVDPEPIDPGNPSTGEYRLSLTVDLLLTVGKTDQAVARLQRALDRSPGSVALIEKKTKAILDGTARGFPCGAP